VPGYLVVDLETVPVPEWTPPEPGAFPPPWACRVICAGWARILPGLEFHAAGVIRGTEPRILTALHAYITRCDRPTIVTYNGRGFDVPVLAARSLVHELSMGWHYVHRDARKRYEEDWHLDIADALADFGGGRMGKLGDLALACNRPGKDGMTGGDVAQAFADGKILDIARYCLGDVAITAHLLVRYKLLQGRIDLDTYRKATTAFDAGFEGAKIG
jgi:predicted PolB exonuclease-like 3'-5' exonuclease